MSSIRNLISSILLILSAAMGSAGILSDTVQEDFFFSHTSYWFASIWTIIASLAVRKTEQLVL